METKFAKSNRLALANTLHPHKLFRTATWYAPHGQVHNQIRLYPDIPSLPSPASTKQTQGLSQVPTLAAIMTSSYNHQAEDENQALHEEPLHTI